MIARSSGYRMAALSVPAAGVGPHRVRASPMRKSLSGRCGRMYPTSVSVFAVKSFVIT